jgi:hypothetical protein
MRFAVMRENLGDGEVGGLLDFRVGVEKGEVQRPGQAPADARLAGAHHSDQHDAALAEPRHEPIDLTAVSDSVTRLHEHVLRDGRCSAHRPAVKRRPQS